MAEVNHRTYRIYEHPTGLKIAGWMNDEEWDEAMRKVKQMQQRLVNDINKDFFGNEDSP